MATRDRDDVLTARPLPPVQYGLTCSSHSAKKKSFVFVKLTEQALLAIEQYVQQAKGPSQKPTIQFQRDSNDGAIHVPGHGSGKKFNFALSQVEGPVRASLECIKQSKSNRVMESLGNIKYKLKVQATDEIYEATRAKMTAANNAAKLNATKVIKESGPKVGRKIKLATAGHKSFASASGFSFRGQQSSSNSNNSSNGHHPAIGNSAAAVGASGGDKSGLAQSKKGPRIAHSSAVKEQPSTALPAVPSPQSYPVSNSSSSRSGPIVASNKYSSQKKSELKPDSRSPSAGLQTNGYHDLISNWANKPTSPSVPEPGSASQKQVGSSNHNISHSNNNDTNSNCSSQTSASSPVSFDDRQKLKADFNSQYAVYKALYSIMEQVSRKFWRLEEKLKNSAEGSEEWNNIMTTIVKEYEELKKDDKFQETKSRVLTLHRKLACLKRQIQAVEPASSGPAVGDNSFSACSRKRFRGDDVLAKFDDNNNDRRAKNLSGALLAI